MVEVCVGDGGGLGIVEVCVGMVEVFLGDGDGV